MADKAKTADKAPEEKGGSNVTWTALVNEFDKLIDGSPWWARTLSIPIIIIIGIIFATNPSLGESLAHQLFTFLRSFGHEVGESAKNTWSWGDDRLKDFTRFVRNHFDWETRARWRARWHAYIGTALGMIMLGLAIHWLSPDTRWGQFFIMIGSLILGVPLLLTSGLLLAITKNPIEGTDHQSVIKKLAISLKYLSAIGLLLIGGWLFSGNSPVWGVIAMAWLGLIMFFNFAAKPGRGFRPAFRVLTTFVGALLLAKVLGVVYDHNPTFQRTMDAVHYFSLGKTAKFMDNGTLEKETGEIQDMIAVKVTKLWATEPKKKAPNGFSLNLNSGDTVVVAVTKSAEDDFGMIYYRARQRKADGSFNDGWVAVRDLKDVEKHPEPHSIISQASAVRYAIPSEFRLNASEGKKQLGWIDKGEKIHLEPTLVGGLLDLTACDTCANCRAAWTNSLAGKKQILGRDYYGDIAPDFAWGMLVVKLPGESWQPLTSPSILESKQAGQIYVAINGKECTVERGEIIIITHSITDGSSI